MNTMTMDDDKMLYDEDKDDEWWWHLLVQVAAPYRKGVFSNMGCSQIYIQCSTLIHQCRHHRHHHGHHQRDLGVRALNEGRICSRLCLTIQDTHPLATLPRLSLSSSSSPPSPSLYIPSGSSKIKEYLKHPKRNYNCIFYFRSLSFVRS